MLTDAEFDSERNHRFIRQQLGAQSVIPAKRGRKAGGFTAMRQALLARHNVQDSREMASRSVKGIYLERGDEKQI